jgi:hypothetical protein
MEIKYSDDVNLHLVKKAVSEHVLDEVVFAEFQNSSVELLDAYDICRKRPGEKDNFAWERNIIIQRYLEICKTYMPLTIKKQEDHTANSIVSCLECGEPMDCDGPENDLVCRSCGAMERSIEASSKNSERQGARATAADCASEEAKETLGSLPNFILIMSNFQGKQRKVPSPEIVDMVKDAISKKVFKDMITPRFISEILEQLKLSDYYHDANWMHREITNIPCPSIVDPDAIVERYKLLYKHCHALMKYGAKATTPRDGFVLKILMQIEGQRCDEDYHTLIKTRQVRNEVNKSMRNACAEMQKLFPQQRWNYSDI